MEQKLEKIIEKLRKDFNVPSIMVSVYKDGKTFFCGGGLADVDNNYEAAPDTIYAIASSSKAFIATALCILADENKLNLDDTVKTHLPDFEMHDDYMTSHLTIRDALGHRSGLVRHDLTWLNNPHITIYEVIRRLKYLPVAFPPRSRMHYQNHMFALASVLVEKVSGKKWYDFVKERILDPLGMTSTYTGASQYRDKNLKTASEPYSFEDGKLKKLPFNNLDNMGCAGCMSSTVRDLDKWARLQLGKGELEGKRIYSEEMAKNLHNPQMIIKSKEMFPYEFDEINFTSYGQGWFIENYRGHKLVHHGGTIDGYKSLVGFLPKEDVAFSILTNLNQNQTPMAIGYTICDLALGLSEIDWGTRFLDFANKGTEEAEKAAQEFKNKAANAPLPTHPLKEYAGTYEHNGYGELSITLEDNGLHVKILGERLAITPMGYNNFYLDFPRHKICIPLKFDYDGEGKICKLFAKLEQMCDMIEFRKV
ncbi:MAG: serine hydrolase [Defluviitaleaceae bacterium]|nr:serine hydrolase [Defluviitaleaceae bacterium]